MSHRCTEGHLKLRRWQSHGMWQRQSSDGGNVTWWHYVSLQETSITHNPGKSSSVNTTVRLLPTERNQVLRVQNMLRCCKWTVKKLTWYYLIRTRWASSSASVCWLRCSGVFAPCCRESKKPKMEGILLHHNQKLMSMLSKPAKKTELENQQQQSTYVLSRHLRHGLQRYKRSQGPKSDWMGLPPGNGRNSKDLAAEFLAADTLRFNRISRNLPFVLDSMHKIFVLHACQ